jgi:putative transcriptional regulator
MTQQEFAGQFGFSIGILKNLEQGHSRPDGPAQVLLTVIAKDPEAVVAALSRSVI